MARNSFAGRVLRAAQTWYRYKTFRAADLIAPLNIRSRDLAKKISVALGDHHRAGRLVKLEPGLYRVARPGEIVAGATTKASVGPEIKEKMWSILRMRGAVTVADLQELTGAKAYYAKEYLQLLVKREIVKALPQPGNQPWRYQLVKRDMVSPPSDDKKADRLKAQRERKKAMAITELERCGRALDRAFARVSEACQRAVKVLKEIDNGQ